MKGAEASDGARVYGYLREGGGGRLPRLLPYLTGCHKQSQTIDEGVQNIREAIQLYVESLIEDGLPVPKSFRGDGW
jgi:hypothetical protein